MDMFGTTCAFSLGVYLRLAMTHLLRVCQALPCAASLPEVNSTMVGCPRFGGHIQVHHWIIQYPSCPRAPWVRRLEDRRWPAYTQDLAAGPGSNQRSVHPGCNSDEPRSQSLERT